MGVDPYLAKALLDWSLLGATPTRPASVFMQLATGTPTTLDALEAPQFTNRCSVQFGAAASPTGSALNASSYIRTTTAAATCYGWDLWDAPTGGNRMFFGTLSASMAIPSGSGARIAINSLKIVIS